MPHFLDWFVPVYLFISVLILVGFGACIYYFEPGLQEAHKWRMQRPLVDRDLRKTMMVRDNLAFGGPEAEATGRSPCPPLRVLHCTRGPKPTLEPLLLCGAPLPPFWT
ncbi:small integral membrane protein 45 isoform X1 [Delphinus delphis]|uniref:small integral membrane protein 45 isoform X1 n=1 Tax=Delphinus delphis TaxID=9728 RepID=UPI0028C50761|nr:small integral membrane protein 45 isoform X2 [Delphinus delphis]